MATTSKGGSRHANCTMSKLTRQRREITTSLALWLSEDCHGEYPNDLMSIDWRASLVPAAAVIPAPIAYTNAVAVKKLVVRLRVGFARWPPAAEMVSGSTVSLSKCGGGFNPLRQSHRSVHAVLSLCGSLLNWWWKRFRVRRTHPRRPWKLL